MIGYGMLKAPNFGINGIGEYCKNSKYKCENKVYKNSYRRRSCTSKTAKKSPFRQTCNVLYHHYVLSRMLLALQ